MAKARDGSYLDKNGNFNKDGKAFLSSIETKISGYLPNVLPERVLKMFLQSTKADPETGLPINTAPTGEEQSFLRDLCIDLIALMFAKDPKKQSFDEETQHAYIQEWITPNGSAKRGIGKEKVYLTLGGAVYSSTKPIGIPGEKLNAVDFDMTVPTASGEIRTAMTVKTMWHSGNAQQNQLEKAIQDGKDFIKYRSAGNIEFDGLYILIDEPGKSKGKYLAQAREWQASIDPKYNIDCGNSDDLKNKVTCQIKNWNLGSFSP